MSSYAAFGASLVYDPASTDLTVAQITNISGPGISTDAIDVTTHQSASAHREFLAGLVDGGEVTFEMVFDAEASASGGSASGLTACNGQCFTRHVVSRVCHKYGGVRAASHDNVTAESRQFVAVELENLALTGIAIGSIK